MHQKIPEESFFNKSVRIANSGVQLMGTMKGLYESGKYIYSGLQMAKPMLALL